MGAPSELFACREGRKTSAENIQVAVGESVAMLTALRLFGFLLMWGGLRLLFDPLSTLLRWIPLLGGILIWGIIIFSFVCACGVSTLTIALAWIAYRPLYGILGIGSVVALWLTMGGISSGAQQPQLQSTL